MPYVIRKVRGKNCYSVKKKLNKNNKTSKKGRTLFSKCTSMKNAKSQLRLLRAIEYGKNFVPRKSAKNRK
jgi:hypothetical protein